MARAGALRLWALLALSVLFGSSRSQAHTLDAATLSLHEVRQGRFLVQLQSSSVALREELERSAKFPTLCHFDGTYLDCGSADLAGTVRFPWLEGSSTRLLVNIAWLDGRRVLRVASASAASFTIYPSRRRGGFAFVWPVATDYCRLGVEHIWTGLDHLLFVVALMLLVRGRRALLATITAFTLAHSISLAATVLGLITLPSPPVEASIALSIVLVCAECLRERPSLGKRAPWILAFSIGLLHGLGFASALQAIGLPEEHVPLALLFFNVGVELGQLSIIAAVASLATLARRVAPTRAWPRLAVIYGAGTIAAYWSLDRLAAVLGR